MDLFYGRAASIERANAGWMDGDAAVVGRAQPRAKALAGIGREVAFDWIWVVVRHDGKVRVTITPVVDGVVRDDLTVTKDLVAVSTVRDEVIRLQLTEPVIFPGDRVAFSRQAVRGVFLTARATIEPLPSDFDEPDGELFGIGGFAASYTPIGIAGQSIAKSGGG